MTSALRRALADERGGIFATLAVMLPVLLLFVALVTDVGNWLEHKKHLQLQADAAALASARELALGNGCVDANIQTRVEEYAGKTAVGGDLGSPYNPQVANSQSGVRLLINQANYYNQSSPNDTDIPDPSPCTAKMVDVKATEEDPPFFLFNVGKKLFGFTPPKWVNAQARVELQQKSGGAGSLPVGVPDPNPKAAAAIFIDETNGNIRPGGVVQLQQGATQTLNGKYLSKWSNPTAAGVGITDDATGVVIALSGDPSWSLSGTNVSTICTQELVECYQGLDLGPYKGLEFIHGYASSGGTTPLVRSVRLCGAAAVGFCGPKSGTPTNLCNDNSAPYFILNAGCKLNIEAQIETGTLTNFQAAVNGNGISGCNGGNPNGCPLKSNNCSWDNTKICYVLEFDNKMPQVNPSAGAIRLNIDWKAKSGTSNVNGSFDNVQGTYAANDDGLYSGPIEYMRVLNAPGGTDANSVPKGTQSFVVEVGVQPDLKNASSVSDPVVKLRVVGGSRNQSLDCDPSNPPVGPGDPTYNNLYEELAYGCFPSYRPYDPSTMSPCPKSVSALWGTPQPPAWHCVAIQTGSATNQVPRGINLRVLKDEKPSSCTSPNNWSMFDQSKPNDGFPAGDPRIVGVFLTQFGAFTGSGSTTRPVTGFATFYITGWTGQGSGFNNPCQGNGDDPSPGPAFIVGHFIKYVDVLNNGGGNGNPCDPAALEPCVAVLTR